MTDKELKKLKRVELLEILFELRKQLDEVKKENEELRQRLVDTENSQLSRTEKMVERLYEDRFGSLPEGSEDAADE